MLSVVSLDCKSNFSTSGTVQLLTLFHLYIRPFILHGCIEIVMWTSLSDGLNAESLRKGKIKEYSYWINSVVMK